MRAFAQKQNQPQAQVSSSLARSNRETFGPQHHTPPIPHLPRTIGNQAEQVMRHERLQTRHIGSGDSGEAAVQPIVHEALRSSGQPLDTATRAFVEPRFGHDFSHLRAHGDAKAAWVTAIRRQDEPAPAAPTMPVQGQEAQPADTSAEAGDGPKLYGLLARSVRGPLTFSPWAFGAKQEPGVGIYSPLMSATGTVIADNSVPVAQYEIGFVQALIVSHMTATYADQKGHPVQFMHIGVSQLPIRDGSAGSTPWMKKQDVKSLDAKEGYIVNTEDRPRNMAPWQTPDRLGSLSSAEGTDFFCTWLAARHKPSGQMHYLGWGTWTVDWGSAFDANSQTGKSTGAGGQEAQSGDKKGPLTPLEGDPVANDSITIRWSATP